MFRIRTKNGVIEISKEIIVVLFMDVFTVFYAVSTKNLSIASRMFPIFLMAGIAIFSIMCLKKAIHFKQLDSNESAAEEIGFGISPKLVGFFSLLIVTLLVFQFIGAWICIFAFLLLSMLLLGVKNKATLILVPLIMDLFIYLVFKMWLAIPLPAGLLTFLA